jgi:dTDP-4-amino-4,6-dideoxygalactose transaminase
MDAVLTCMVDEKIGPGEVVRRLSEEGRAFFGVEGALAFRSPRRALECTLEVCGLEPGSAVMLSALAPAWQYEGVLRGGFKPLVLDVEGESPLVGAEAVAQGMRSGGRSLVLHEALGFLPDMGGFSNLGIPVIEDSSQAVGATWQSRLAGTFGTFAIVGLEAHHSLTAGGGALLLAKGRRETSTLKKYAEEPLGVDILPDLNSALALVQLKEFSRNEERRREIREKYLAALLHSRHHTFQVPPETESPAYSFPVVLSQGFKDIKQYASRKDIEVCLAFEDSIAAVYESSGNDCLNARSLALRTALFPLYPLLSSEQAGTISQLLTTLP